MARNSGALCIRDARTVQSESVARMWDNLTGKCGPKCGLRRSTHDAPKIPRPIARGCWSDIAVLKLKRAIPGARLTRMASAQAYRQPPSRLGYVRQDRRSPFRAGPQGDRTNRCKRIYKQTDTKIGKNITCTQATLQFGACHGDSGGPLMKGGQLVGLVSGGDPTCSGATPDLFVSLKQMRKWINQQTR